MAESRESGGMAIDTAPPEAAPSETPTLLLEHSGGEVLIAPVGFGLGIAGLIVAVLRPERTLSTLTLFALLALLSGFFIWAFLFYSSPRRIQVKEGRVNILYFSGKSRTCTLSELRWLRPTAWLDKMFGVERIAATGQGFQFRVWSEIETTKAFLNLVTQGEA